MITGPEAGKCSLGRGADSMQAGRCTGGIHVQQLVADVAGLGPVHTLMLELHTWDDNTELSSDSTQHTRAGTGPWMRQLARPLESGWHLPHTLVMAQIEVRSGQRLSLARMSFDR